MLRAFYPAQCEQSITGNTFRRECASFMHPLNLISRTVFDRPRNSPSSLKHSFNTFHLGEGRAKANAWDKEPIQSANRLLRTAPLAIRNEQTSTRDKKSNTQKYEEPIKVFASDEKAGLAVRIVSNLAGLREVSNFSSAKRISFSNELRLRRMNCNFVA